MAAGKCAVVFVETGYRDAQGAEKSLPSKAPLGARSPSCASTPPSPKVRGHRFVGFVGTGTFLGTSASFSVGAIASSRSWALSWIVFGVWGVDAQLGLRAPRDASCSAFSLFVKCEVVVPRRVDAGANVFSL